MKKKYIWSLSSSSSMCSTRIRLLRQASSSSWRTHRYDVMTFQRFQRRSSGSANSQMTSLSISSQTLTLRSPKLWNGKSRGKSSRPSKRHWWTKAEKLLINHWKKHSVLFRTLASPLSAPPAQTSMMLLARRSSIGELLAQVWCQATPRLPTKTRSEIVIVLTVPRPTPRSAVWTSLLQRNNKTREKLVLSRLHQRSQTTANTTVNDPNPTSTGTISMSRSMK